MLLGYGWFLILGKGRSIRRDREVSKLDKTWVENNTVDGFVEHVVEEDGKDEKWRQDPRR